MSLCIPNKVKKKKKKDVFLNSLLESPRAIEALQRLGGVCSCGGAKDEKLSSALGGGQPLPPPALKSPPRFPLPFLPTFGLQVEDSGEVWACWKQTRPCVSSSHEKTQSSLLGAGQGPSRTAQALWFQWEKKEWSRGSLSGASEGVFSVSPCLCPHPQHIPPPAPICVLP